MKTMEEAFSWEPCILKHESLWDCGIGLTRYELASERKRKRVECTSLDGKVVIYDSRKSAGLALKKSTKSIGDAIRMKRLVQNMYRLKELDNA